MTSCPACRGTGREQHWSPATSGPPVRIYALGKFQTGRLILTRAPCVPCRGTGKLAEVLLHSPPSRQVSKL